MNKPVVPASLSGEEIECGLSPHPGSDPECLGSRIGFLDYPFEKIIYSDDRRAGKRADFCSRVIEIIQGRHVKGTTSDHASFCNHTDKVYRPERDNKSCSVRIFKVNNFFSHDCIVVLCAGPADNGSGPGDGNLSKLSLHPDTFQNPAGRRTIPGIRGKIT